MAALYVSGRKRFTPLLDAEKNIYFTRWRVDLLVTLAFIRTRNRTWRPSAQHTGSCYRLVWLAAWLLQMEGWGQQGHAVLKWEHFEFLPSSLCPCLEFPGRFASEVAWDRRATFTMALWEYALFCGNHSFNAKYTNAGCTSAAFPVNGKPVAPLPGSHIDRWLPEFPLNICSLPTNQAVCPRVSQQVLTSFYCGIFFWRQLYISCIIKPKCNYKCQRAGKNALKEKD